MQLSSIAMDKQTLLEAIDFARARLLGSIETIEKSGQDPNKVLAWRPGPGRAHIAWQLMHCAATYHKNLYTTLLNQKPANEALVANFAYGSTPSDQNIPGLALIKDTLASTFAEYRSHLASLDPADFATRQVGPPGRQRTLGQWVMLYTWHEAHHQGQIHLTWNLYRAAHGLT